MNHSSDIRLKNNLATLFNIAENNLRKKNLPKEVLESFVRDGFYPGYSVQPIRVLFVGRESLSMWGDYTERMYEMYQSNRIGSATVNQYKFHALLFYVAYGFTHGFPEWKDIPWASDLAKSMENVKKGTSFAFMNLSKFSNWNEKEWTVDWELIKRSMDATRDGDENLLAKEIDILDPHVICSMNIAESLKEIAVQSESVDLPAEYKAVTSDVKLYQMKFMNNKQLVVDMWHFSAPGKPWQKCYYDPLKAIWPFIESILR